MGRRASRSSLRSSGADAARGSSRSRERGRRALSPPPAGGRRRTRTITQETLAEEPESYAETELYGGANGDGTASTPTQEELASPAEEGQGNGQDGDSDDETAPLSPSSSNPSRPRPFPISQLYSSLFPLSPLTRNVLKCVLAYFVASLFTFVQPLSDLVGAPWDVDGPVKSAHVIATVATYFMPASTIGGMLEKDAYLLVGAAFATFLCCGSMAMAVLFERLDLLQLGHALVLIVWLGGGYSLVAYAKVVMNKPALSTACSLISLICSGIITKEGAYHIGEFRTRAIEQVLLIAAIGSVISNVICFVVWPQSATDKLQDDLNKTLSSFSTLLEMLTKTFLLEPNLSVSPASLKSAINAHQRTFTSLRTSLSQAKWEILDPRIGGHNGALASAHDAAVESMQRLAQGLTGMRAGCVLQWEIMRAREEGRAPTSPPGEEDGPEKRQLWDEVVVLDRFKEHVGPSLQALAQTSTATLSLLRTSLTRPAPPNKSQPAQPDDLETGEALPAEASIRVQQELETALRVFKREHSRGVKILYRALPAQTIYVGDALDLSKDPYADQPPAGADQAPNDSLFRIYHYCFNLEEWASELLHLVEIFISLRETEHAAALRAAERKRRWGVLSPVARAVGVCFGGRKEGRAEQLGRQFARAMKTPRKKHHSVFPELIDGALSHLPSSSASLARHSLIARLKLSFWHLLYHLRQPNVLFAIKTGAGVAILASAAFIPRLRPIWLEWRGEWSLVSYFVVCAPALGDGNFLAAGRILGTAVGALVAVAFYSAFPENPYVLPVLCALFSAPCFYVAVTRPQYAPSSRFTLLAFNLTCLYSFNIREVEHHVTEVAFRRFIAVCAGVLWALVINTYVWPFEARRELRRGLSEFFLNSCYLYERLVRIYSLPPQSLSRTGTIRHKPSSGSLVDNGGDEVPNERTSLLKKQARLELDEAAEDFVVMEIELQLLLIRLQGLLAATRLEPRLKGPFPVAAYRAVLAACQSILDSLTAVARMTNREAWFSSVRRDFVIPVNRERREMVGNIILFFSILSSAVSLKTPMPAYLPPAAAARDRLVARLRELEVVKRRLVRGGSESLLYYAYTTTMRDVIVQLEELGRSFQALFGIIGGSTVEDFEALFRAEPVEDVEAGSNGESIASTKR
ncbi:hypothetical protein JCM8097_005927 [Rhodosporidiobolus ruineniae]